MVAGSEGSPVFDYTSLDFEGVEKDLIAYAQSRFGTEVWTDFNASNEGRRLIELMSYATDLLSYTENAHAMETVVASLIREQNFRNIVKTFDFTLKSASPSRTMLQFTIDPDYLPLQIPRTFKVADKKTGTAVFQPDVTGTATDVTYLVAATQGDGIEDELLGTADGTAGQAYALGKTPLIDGTLSVFVGGTEYIIIKNFIEAGPLAAVCQLETSEALVTTVKFGDGINGKIPSVGQDVTASYKVGGGLGVNFPRNAVTRLVSGIPGVLEVTNVTVAEGGGPKQSLQSAKRIFPLSVKANERCVTLEDYATSAVELVNGVLRAYAVSGLFQAGGNPVLLFVVPNGGGDVSASLSNLIVSTLRYGVGPTDPGRSMAGRRVFVRNPIYVELLVTADVFVNRGSVASQVGARVNKAYLTRYALEANDFGSEADLQEAYNVVDPKEQKIDGLARVYLRQFSVKPYCGRYVTKPSTGTGAAIGIRTNVNTQRREWGIQVIPGKRFYVYQRQLGIISGISDHSLEDEQAAYPDGALVTTLNGWRLRVREQEQNETFTIVANVGGSITVSGVSFPGKVSSLLVLATNKDTYAVERKESGIGKILSILTISDTAQGGVSLGIDGSGEDNGFILGDEVLVQIPAGDSYLATITINDSDGTLGLSVAAPYGLPTGTTISHYWWSDDGTCGFALVDGSSAFVNGDELYVDTYAQAGDIRLRPENYPVLVQENLTVNPVGGVK
jgi:hypothetical protein